jgi:hypothetical protein
VVPVHFDSWSRFTEGRDEREAAFTAAGLADHLHGLSSGLLTAGSALTAIAVGHLSQAHGRP